MATGSILLPIPPQGFDGTNPPGMRWSNGRPEILLDGGSTNEPFYITFRMPQDYASGPVLKWQYKMASATTGNVEVGCDVMAVTDADAADVDSDSYATANVSGAVAVPGTAGHLDEISLTLTNADSLAAGDYVSLKLYRNAADTTDDTAAGDMEVVALTLEYTTS